MTDRATLTAQFMAELSTRAEGQDAFLQAAKEVAHDVLPVEKANSDYARAQVLRRLSEPDRVLAFRVVWEDDAGKLRLNRGWRVQTSNAIGPYKGGLRFHPSVDLDTLKFLGFEQVFKNALTDLPLGGGKGGADFDPRGCSDREIMRFCQAFMTELAPFIGPERDVPAGDINVGPREIGYLFGTYKKLHDTFNGGMTGKGIAFGGSKMRVEATGYGLIYFVQAMLEAQGHTLEGQRVAISGKGNVATHAARRAALDGAKVITLSDTSGTLVAEDGLSQDAIAWVQDQKAAGRDIATPPKAFGLAFKEGASPWDEAPDIALPCATQNELDGEMAQTLVKGGMRLLAEGANMPLTAKAATTIREAGIPYAPGKAANAGGVAVSGLEMSQMSHRRFQSADQVDADLRQIMADIHARIAREARGGNHIDYRRGANVAGYRKVADALVAYGTN